MSDWQTPVLIVGVVLMMLTSWWVYWITSDTYRIMQVRGESAHLK